VRVTPIASPRRSEDDKSRFTLPVVIDLRDRGGSRSRFPPERSDDRRQSGGLLSATRAVEWKLGNGAHQLTSFRHSRHLQPRQPATAAARLDARGSPIRNDHRLVTYPKPSSASGSANAIEPPEPGKPNDLGPTIGIGGQERQNPSDIWTEWKTSGGNSFACAYRDDGTDVMSSAAKPHDRWHAFQSQQRLLHFDRKDRWTTSPE
jgi:hypothetical protein